MQRAAIHEGRLRSGAKAKTKRRASFPVGRRAAASALIDRMVVLPYVRGPAAKQKCSASDRSCPIARVWLLIARADRSRTTSVCFSSRRKKELRQRRKDDQTVTDREKTAKASTVTA